MNNFYYNIPYKNYFNMINILFCISFIKKNNITNLNYKNLTHHKIL